MFYSKWKQVTFTNKIQQVGSLGWPDSALANMTRFNDAKQYGFHDTGVHEKIKYAFHALALDERRRPFSPTLWNLPPGSKTRLIQCWFPGMLVQIASLVTILTRRFQVFTSTVVEVKVMVSRMRLIKREMQNQWQI